MAIRPLLYLLLTLLVALVALRRGGQIERLGGFVLVGVQGLDPVLDWLIPYHPGGIFLSHFILDALLCALFLTVSLRADRVWPMVMTSLQGVLLIAHPVRLLLPGIESYTYGVMQTALSWLMPVVLLIAVTIAGPASVRHPPRPYHGLL